ncbi:MAG: PTS transporter subunit EIIA [Ignavibacteria bacterium]|nr:PTS transporter subunit EIIA [Ignavibacteria bacterium]
MHLSAEQITLFLIGISVLLLFARLTGEIFNKFKQASVIGEILAGIILGPTVLGGLFPEIYNSLFMKFPQISIAMDGLTTMAVVMLLLVSGMEVDLSVVFHQSKSAVYTSFLGIIVPFVISFPFAYYIFTGSGMGNENNPLIFAIFVGIALSISALPVIARTLMDLKLLKTPIGQIIITSAIFNDLIGWIGFSVLIGLIGIEENSFSPGMKVLMIFLFTVIMLFVVRKILNSAIPVVQRKFSFPGGILNFIFILGFSAAAFTEWIGIHAIFGAFIMGIIIGDSAHLKEETREMIHQFVTNLFAPLFFVSIGLRVNFIAHFDFLLVVSILIIAFAGKIVGCGFGAKLSGLDKNSSLIIGFGMNSRGAMEIILGLLALQFGLINENFFVALVIMALVTSVLSAPLMSYFLKRRKKETLDDLLSPETIVFSEAENKTELLKELAQIASGKCKLNYAEVLKGITAREKSFSTGIGNFVAIPHARMDIKNPAILIGISKKGIDFEAHDNKKAMLIYFILTPKNQNEVQLKLLAEIARKSRDKNKIQKIAELTSKDQIVKEIKLL